MRSPFRNLQNRFRADGRVVFAGCGSAGVDSDLLELVSHPVVRTVAGFSEPILYAIDGTTRGPMINDRHGRPIGRRIDDDARITMRGKVMYSKAANKIEDIFGSDMVGSYARTHGTCNRTRCRRRETFSMPFAAAKPAQTSFLPPRLDSA